MFSQACQGHHVPQAGSEEAKQVLIPVCAGPEPAPTQVSAPLIPVSRLLSHTWGCLGTHYRRVGKISVGNGWLSLFPLKRLFLLDLGRRGESEITGLTCLTSALSPSWGGVEWKECGATHQRSLGPSFYPQPALDKPLNFTRPLPQDRPGISHPTQFTSRCELISQDVFWIMKHCRCLGFLT